MTRHEDGWPAPRLEYVSRSFLRSVIAHCEEKRRESLKLIAEEPGKLSQTRHSLLIRECLDLGLFYYAAGLPLKQTRDAFAEAAHATHNVFELRGTEHGIPMTYVTLDPTKPLGDPAYARVR